MSWRTTDGESGRAAAWTVACALLAAGCAAPGPEVDPGDGDIGVEMASAIYLDAHAHIGSCDLFEQAATCQADAGGETCDPGDGLVTTAEAYLAAYPDAADGSGSSLAQVLSMAYQWSAPSVAGSDYQASEQEVANVQCQNDYTVQEAALYPDRLLPFCSVNPKKSYALAEIDRCVDELGAAGLKLHFSSSQVDVREPRTAAWVQEVLAHAAGRGLPVVVHFGDLEILCGTCDGDPDEQNRQGMAEAMAVMLEEILPSVPGLHLTFAHLTGVGAFPDWTQRTFQMLIDAYRSDTGLQAVDLYVDLAAVFATEATVNGFIPGVTAADLETMAAMLQEWGLERVLWGSDLETGGFDDTVAGWPLSDADFNLVARADGAGFRAAAAGRDRPEEP